MQATRHETIFYTHTLPNGLQLLGQYMPGLESAAGVFWVQTGARDETAAHMGVSHFLEHMAFRGNETRGSEAIDRAFEEMGAEYNAATSLEMTYYWARVLTENVGWMIEVLAELTHPSLPADMFEQERPVILEEIARSHDNPGSVLFNHFMRQYFGQHGLAHRVLGTEETISQLRVEAMRAYWQRRYGARNMLFAIAGNFSWELVVDEVETLTRDWAAGESGRELSTVAFQPSVQVVQNDTFAQEQVVMGFPTVDRRDPRYYTAALLTTVLGDDTGSRLFWALHQTGLAESAGAWSYELEDNGVMLVQLSTEPDKVETAVKVARDELHRLQEFGISEEELARARAKLNSSEVIGGESANVRVMSLIQSWLMEGRLETLEEIRAKIDAVTVEDVRALLDAYPVWPRAVVTAVGPLSEVSLHPILER